MITITAAGFLAEKPVLTVVSPTKCVCEFTVLSSRQKLRGGERLKVWERAVFFVWGEEAEKVAKYLDKGSDVVCTGLQETDSWTPKGTTETRFITKYKLTSWELQHRSQAQLRPEDSRGNNRPAEAPLRFAARPTQERSASALDDPDGLSNDQGLTM